jgi:hypothetical protein
MTKLTVDAALDHKVAHAMGLKSVHNCEKWVGLTEEEINACDPSEEFWGLHKIARAIEAKLKEKNT